MNEIINSGFAFLDVLRLTDKGHTNCRKNAYGFMKERYTKQISFILLLEWRRWLWFGCVSISPSLDILFIQYLI